MNQLRSPDLCIEFMLTKIIGKKRHNLNSELFTAVYAKLSISYINRTFYKDKLNKYAEKRAF